MSLREDRKRLQRTVLYWVDNCPAEKVLAELFKLKQTIDTQIEVLTSDPDPGKELRSATAALAVAALDSAGQT
jgi:hypothetical protein